jgi:steroid 5-alpha reductase family enzyme
VTVLYLKALAAIAVSLSVLMAGAWVVQQRTGNSGWVDTIWTFSLGLVGAGSALWPVAGEAPNIRQWLVAALVAIWSLRLGVHIAVRTAAISDDPRCAAFASEWGVDSPRKMFVFLQNQGLGSIPLVFSVFVAAHFPSDLLRWQDYLGALILLAAIVGEALADAQLKAFRENPTNKGRVCDVGLWRWSRHPTISSNGSAGSLIPSSACRLTTSGVGQRCWRRSLCTGSRFTSPASHRWKSRCCARAATATATTSRAPVRSSRYRRKHDPEKWRPVFGKDHAQDKGVPI